MMMFSVSCVKKFSAPVPDTAWGQFDALPKTPLPYGTRQKMEGIYTIVDGFDQFGGLAALKWSYTLNGTDTSFNLSMFCENEVAYFICEAKQQDSNILLNGYWRQMVRTETGKGRFTISSKNGAKQLLGTAAFADSIIIEGTFGSGDAAPDRSIKLKYLRPLYKGTPLQIVAHRGGGRSSDLLPASENSAEIIRLASRFGATGIEVDVRLTSDGVPILFHDVSLNERLIRKNGMVGPIENYSYTQLNTLVRLLQGEHIPTLREALTTVVYNTPLTFVWLDTKLQGDLQLLRDIQKEFIQKSVANGRPVDISIGIPDKTVLNNFLHLSDYKTAPAVCELSIEDVEASNSHIWGPRWTLGTQNDEVARMHAEGRKAFVWTLDVPGNIATFLKEGHFDGILSNYPSAVAFYYYARQ
ncbi:MAG: glycerophosphodiester phosphodiesterase [Sediminibacterium sp.]|nr:glycerophosphodiester phosphodiesterase [Sediminibacterium sp.]